MENQKVIKKIHNTFEKKSTWPLGFRSNQTFFQPKLSTGSTENLYDQETHENSFRAISGPDPKRTNEDYFFEPVSVNGPPVIQKQETERDAPPQTPCPNSVSIGTLARFNHSNLPASQKDNWGTYLGVASQMNVGPGPDHSGHCMKESLSTISNNCPAQVYDRGGRTSEPCTGNKCLDINRYGRAGDGLTRSTVSDGPTSFLDLHRTRSRMSLLEGTNVGSCSVVCEQTYTCDRTHATTGRFRITREYQAGTHTKANNERMHITTGTVRKEIVT